jgi:glycosyltransferase involved in cell wall biosynthesis
MLISVIIPTLNRPAYLGQCLAALKAEIGNCGEREIIVVDDGSQPAMKRLNREVCLTYGAIFLEHERNRGMAVARNTGLSRATGVWIVFIDDDVCVEKGWGAALLAVLDRAGTDIAGIQGKVRGIGNGLWDREVEVANGRLCLTCHIVYRRDALAKAGDFDPAFEHEGPFHEDQELAVRVRAWGTLLFEPTLRAIHLPRKVRLFKYLKEAPARIEKLLKADFYFWSKHPAAYGDFRHAKNFWGTYRAVLFKYPYVTMKRRPIRNLILHPLQTPALALSCFIAQFRAWTLVPCFLKRSLQTKGPPIVWFAADIPASSQGGVNRLMKGLSFGLSRQGIRTEIIYNNEYELLRAAGYIGFSLGLGIKLLLRPLSRPDWIIARSTDALFCAVVKRIFRLKTRIVLQNHGWEEYVYAIQKRLTAALVDRPVTWKSRLIRFPLLRATLAMADYCLCGTIDDIRWIRGRYPAALKKLRYVPNGVEPKRSCFWAGRADLQHRFLCVGTMTWRKNLTYAVALFRRLAEADPNARLYLVGTGEIPAALNFSAQERITVVPSLLMEQMDEWYERCPFFLHTARYEGGHPLALLEAMSFGAVPFVVPIPSVREIVRHGNNGIHLGGIDAGKDAEIIASAIADKNRIATLGKQAYSTAMRNRWKRQTVRLERVIF